MSYIEFGASDRRRWKSAPWCIIDCEATTPDPDGDPEAKFAVDASQARIFQVAARFHRGPRAGETFTRWVNPGVPIAPKIVEVCGLTPEKLAAIAAAPPFAEVAADLVKLLDEPAVWVTYNGDQYDLPLLSAELVRAGREPLTWNKAGARVAVDIQVPVNVYYRGMEHPRGRPNKGPRTLGATAIRLGVARPPEVELHDAGGDTLLLQLVAEAMTAFDAFSPPHRPKLATHPPLADSVGEYITWQSAQAARVAAEYARWGVWLYRDWASAAICIGAGAEIGQLLSRASPGWMRGFLHDWGPKYGLTDAAAAIVRAELDSREGRG